MRRYNVKLPLHLLRRVFLFAVAATPMVATTVMANHPDSIYVKPDVKNGTRNFQIAYSQDRKHWTHVDCNLFESDYGPWGSEKKLYYPVMSYDGKTFYATFIPNPKQPQIAKTQSDNFTLWKPQDYPYLDQKAFETLLEKQKKASEDNVIRIPYKALQNLLDKKILREQNWAKESENFVASAARLAKEAKGIKATVTIDAKDVKDISPNLMGIFFEDISYAADGGLYAELIENRDFEYSEKDRRGWTATTAWNLEGEHISWQVATQQPLHENNYHYLQLTTTKVGGALVNNGWDGIPLKAKEKYLLSLFVKGKGSVKVSLMADTETLASCNIKATTGWKQQKAVLTPKKSADKARLVISPLQEGTLDIDFVSLFPKNTFKGRENGLRNDLAQVIADLKPRFVRFPGGCASHGQCIDNIYHWQATIGDLWERQGDMNIWSYHQTRGLGFYEYFTFCEDLGAEPLPVLAAGVPCQNSWKGGNGQQGGIPFEEELNGQPSPYQYNGKPLTMESYLQELLDLIEWANGDAKTSPLAALRAKAGHPKPFGLKYLGIGNEDLISDVFMKRYLFLMEGIKKAHPEITLVGTVGPFWEGSDYEYGWQAAKEHHIAIVDEHYYNSPGWYFNHRNFYDNYDRQGTKVYLGEWASKGNHVSNALAEAAYLTHVEKNADVVVMASYAPLLAKEGYTKWNPDLIYFNNTEVKPTANYEIQKLFGQHAGDEYIASQVEAAYLSDNGHQPLKAEIEKRIDCSVTRVKKTGEVDVKMVSLLPHDAEVTLKVADLATISGEGKTQAVLTLLTGPQQPDRNKAWKEMTEREIEVGEEVTLTLPAWSVAALRITKQARQKAK